MVQYVRAKAIVIILSLIFIGTAVIPAVQAQFSEDLSAPTWQAQPLTGPLTPLVESTEWAPHGGNPMPLTSTPLVVHLPTTQISMILHLNPPASYLNTTLSNVPAGYDPSSRSYYGWCGDYFHYIQLGVVYQATLYSTYDNALPSYLYHQNWSKVNYILNHKIGTDYQQIQNAIWYLLDCGNHGLNTNGWAMVNNAIANGGGYIPGSGDKCAVILGVNPTVQRTIFELTVPPRIITLNYDGQGTVAKNPDLTAYVYGQTVNLTASANPGWTFDHWSGDATGSANPTTVTMTGNKTVTAVFTQNHYTLSTATDGSGTVNRDPDQSTYTYGQVVHLTAQADLGWTFDHWNGDATGTSNPVDVTINGNKAVTAYFTQNHYTLSITTDGSGTVTKEPDQTTYTYGQVVTLTAQADLGWTFDHWTGDAIGSSATATITMTGDKAATAYFTQDQYTLTVSTDGSGSVILDPDQATYTYGQIIQLTAEADLGWTFDHWSGGTASTANPATITIVGNTAVTAHFTQNQYTITVTLDGSGSVIKNPDQSTYTYGQVVHLTAQADPGWTFDHWSGDVTGNANAVDLTILGNAAVGAHFTQNHYTLTVSTDGSGNVMKNPDQSTYTYGQVVQLTAQAAVGWTFDHWSGDATGSANPTTVTMTGNKAVTAHFTQNQYTLTITTDGSGSVQKSPDQTTYTYGQVVTLTAVPAQGWSFSYWSGDATGSTNPIQITIDGNKAVAAHFTQNQYTLTITIDGSGNVTKNPDQNTYTYGQVVTLSAFPSAGWSFDHWSGDATGSTNPTTVTIAGNMAVTAHFTQDQYTLSLTLDGSGSVAKDPDQTTYTYGQVVTLTATAAQGWSFDHWSGDATGSANPTTVTMTGNKAVTAHFTQNQYTLTITTHGSGTVVKDPDQDTYTYGQVVGLTAQPAQDWVFDYWTGDVTGSANPTSITITGDAAVTAHFTEQDLTPPLVNITQPSNAVYLMDKPLCPFVMPLFFHNITVKVNASDNQSGIDHVVIYVDNVSKATLTTPPYRWVWTETKPMKHTLTAVAFDKAGNHASDSKMVWRWRFHPIIIGLFMLKALFMNKHNGTPGMEATTSATTSAPTS